MEKHARHSARRVGELPKLKPRPKHPFKVFIKDIIFYNYMKYDCTILFNHTIEIFDELDSNGHVRPQLAIVSFNHELQLAFVS